MELEKFVTELEKVDWTASVTKQCKPYFAKELGMVANSFSFKPEKVAAAILANEAATKNFAILASACAISMGYTYLCDEKHGGHWDERNLASQKYFYEHLDGLKNAFVAAFGSEMPFCETPKYQYFSDDCRLKSSWLLTHELKDFECEHHTIQQSLARLFVIFLGAVAPESRIDAEHGFPFI